MRRVSFVVAPVLALFSTLLLAPAASAADRDCSDFATQRGALRFFVNHNPGADPHGLDSDGDGMPCESNPCPCGGAATGPGTPGGQTRPQQIRQRARVVEVIDGDTVDVRISSRMRRVRMVGIDTPEVYGGAECGGRQASRSLRRLLPRGTRVLLLSDTSQDTRDRYGRQLRYVHRSGEDINRAQVRRGWARVYVYDNNPFRRAADYRRAQRGARSGRQGVWRAC